MRDATYDLQAYLLDNIYEFCYASQRFGYCSHSGFWSSLVWRTRTGIPTLGSSSWIRLTQIFWNWTQDLLCPQCPHVRAQAKISTCNGTFARFCCGRFAAAATAEGPLAHVAFSLAVVSGARRACLQSFQVTAAVSYANGERNPLPRSRMGATQFSDCDTGLPMESTAG